MRQMAHLAIDDQLGTAGLVASWRGAFEDVEAVPDGRQGIPELVAEHGQKLVLAAVGFAQRVLGQSALGDVECGDRQRLGVDAKDGRGEPSTAHSGLLDGRLSCGEDAAVARLELLERLAPHDLAHEGAGEGLLCRADASGGSCAEG